MDSNLKSKITKLIETDKEDFYWDFKQEHHTNKASLVHDIICMANNVRNMDSYLIFGVENEKHKIIGVENDQNRRNQQYIIDILGKLNFAGGVRPQIEMQTLYFGEHEIDVLIIKNSFHVPFYLEKKYCDGKKCVYPYHIYSRVGDTNTPIDSNADIDIIENLWKKRFRINEKPINQIQHLLKNTNEWKWDLMNNNFYHKIFPHFNIKYSFSQFLNDQLANNTVGLILFFQENPLTDIGTVNIFLDNIQLESYEIARFNFNTTVVLPDRDSPFFDVENNFDVLYYYYNADDIRYDLNKFIIGKLFEGRNIETKEKILEDFQKPLSFFLMKMNIKIFLNTYLQIYQYLIKNSKKYH